MSNYVLNPRFIKKTNRTTRNTASMLSSALLASVVLLTGCETTGVIHGVNNEGSAVQFDYQQGFLENDGQLRVTLPDGEQYNGKFVQKSSSTSGDAWRIGESSGDDSLTFSDSITVSSHTEALLIGNRGNTMTCRFQLADPDFGIDGGGIGTCKTSHDQTINMTF